MYEKSRVPSIKIKRIMKKILIIIITLLPMCFFAQLLVGTSTAISASSSASLEFENGQNRGLILPWVNSASEVASAGVVDGTLIFDANDKKVKLYSNGSWADFTKETNGNVDLSLQNPKTEDAEAKMIIGSNSETDMTPGIVVLSDTDKAMILPKVANPHLTIEQPSPGLMVYDTISHQLAVYNGTVWTFWRAD